VGTSNCRSPEGEGFCPSQSPRIENKPLFRAYLLKERLAKILDYVRPGHVRRALEQWLWWASHSRLKPFVKVARTIRKHKQDVLAYIEERYTNGIVEGFNNLLRMVARRAFGFHTAKALIKMLFLVAGGIETNPPLPGVEWCSLEA
jgi:transposase